MASGPAIRGPIYQSRNIPWGVSRHFHGVAAIWFMEHSIVVWSSAAARSAHTRAPPLQKTRAAPLTPDERRRAHVQGQPRSPWWDTCHAGPGPPRAPEPAVGEPLGRPALARPGGSMAGGGPCREGGPGAPRRGGGLAAGAGRWGGGEVTKGGAEGRGAGGGGRKPSGKRVNRAGDNCRTVIRGTQTLCVRPLRRV